MALRPKRSAGKVLSAVGALAVAAGFASIPFLFSKSQIELTAKKSALTGTQIQRGAYLNSGSKDVGIDPDWDLATGTYKRRSGTFQPTEEEVAEFRRQHGMRDPLEVERILEQRRKASKASGAEKAET